MPGNDLMTRDLLRSLELPHWLMLAGALLVIVGCIGLTIRRRKSTETDNDPVSKPGLEAHPKMPPLPTLLDSRRKVTRIASDNRIGQHRSAGAENHGEQDRGQYNRPPD